MYNLYKKNNSSVIATISFVETFSKRPKKGGLTTESRLKDKRRWLFYQAPKGASKPHSSLEDMHTTDRTDKFSSKRVSLNLKQISLSLNKIITSKNVITKPQLALENKNDLDFYPPKALTDNKKTKQIKSQLPLTNQKHLMWQAQGGFSSPQKSSAKIYLNKIYQGTYDHIQEIKPESLFDFKKGLTSRGLILHKPRTTAQPKPPSNLLDIKNTKVLTSEHKHLRRAASYSKISEINLITISLASANRIRQWAEKTLPNGKVVGEVLNPETVHYKTLKPIKGGLFCERIFGPLKDHECACGKKFHIKQYLTPGSKMASACEHMGEKSRISPEQKRYFCRVCDVEYTYSIIRRTQLGYINLASPTTHVWFVKGLPSYISILLDMKKKHLQNIIYNVDTSTLEHAVRGPRNLPMLQTSIYETWQKIMSNKPRMGFRAHQKMHVDQKNYPQKYGQNPNQGLQDSLRLNMRGCSPSSIEHIKAHQYKQNIKKYYSEPLQAPFRDLFTFTDSGLRTTPSKALCNIKDAQHQKKNSWFKHTTKQAQHPSRSLYCSGAHMCFYLILSKGARQPQSGLENSLSTRSKIFRAQASQRHLINKSDNKTKFFNKETAVFILKKGFFEIKSKRALIRQSKRLVPVLATALKSLPVGNPNKILSIDKKCMVNLKEVNPLCTNSVINNKSTKVYSLLVNKIRKLFTKMHSPFVAKRVLQTPNGVYKAQRVLTSKDKGKPGSVGTNPTSVQRGLQAPLGLNHLRSFGLYLYNILKKKQGNRKHQHKSTVPTINWLVSQADSNLWLNTKSEDIVRQKRDNTTTKYAIMLLLNLRKKYKIGFIRYFNLLKSSVKIKLVQKLCAFMCFYLLLSKDAQDAVHLRSKMLKNHLPNHKRGLLYSESLGLKHQKNNHLGASNKAPAQALKDYSTSKNSTFYFLDLKQTLKITAYKLYNSLILDCRKKFSIFLLLAQTKHRWLKIKCLKAQEGIGQKEKTTNVDAAKPHAVFVAHLLIKAQASTWQKRGSNISALSGDQYNPFFDIIYTPIDFLKSLPETKPLIVNNIYCISHRELWANDKHWYNFARYYYGQNLYLARLPAYKDRNSVSDNIFNFAHGLAPTSQLVVNYNKSSTNINTAFSGAGLIEQLLNEFTFTELKKMDKQNRLLLFDYNKYIKNLSKKISSKNPRSKKEYYKACQVREVLIRRTKYTRRVLNFFDITHSAEHISTSIKDRSKRLVNPKWGLEQSKLTSKEVNKQELVSDQLTKHIKAEKKSLNLILTCLPVLPPMLRPVLKLSGQFTVSDLNRLYQRIIYRNDRLKFFLKDSALRGSFEMKYAQRLLQEAVDNLIQNGKSGVVPEKDTRGRLLKSLSDILKGKQGRFRQYLLGKRVDYSGRSVIVVGPRLKIHECGIPKEMALVLYSPFLIKRILNEKLADTYIAAKKLIKTNNLLVSQLLREIMRSCPVLLNRAPSLHRLSFQAFQPKLVDGKAILLHPLVCTAFNADFDGDQMAVHVPITFEARAEAWKLMLTRNNLLSPSTGDPLILPSQDMVLGCYYLTTNIYKFKKGSGLYFNNITDVLNLYNLQLIYLHKNIWVNIKGLFDQSINTSTIPQNNVGSVGTAVHRALSVPTIDSGNILEQPLEIRLGLAQFKLNNQPINKKVFYHLNYIEIYSKSHNHLNLNGILTNLVIRTTPGKILFNSIIKNKIV